MTDFTDDEMREIILRVLDENAARMAEKYGIPRQPQSKDGTPTEVVRQPALADMPK